jgi:hypothetical protein
MNGNFIREDGFSVIHATTDEELKKIYDIRYSGEYWKYWEERNCKTEEEFFNDEKKRDAAGIVLAFRNSMNGIIGTIRFIKIGFGNSLTEKIMKDHGIEYPVLENSWEVGRFILDEENRSQKNMFCFIFLALEWLINNTGADYVFTHCPIIISRIHTRIGLQIIAKNLIIRGYKKKYAITFGKTSHIKKIMQKIELKH